MSISRASRLVILDPAGIKGSRVATFLPDSD
jgi:hypothetical protein